jgi:hypothetical protein
MESAIWIAPIIILSWPVVVLIINTIVLVVTKEPGQDTNGQVRRPKSIFASKKIIGYTAAFLLPINFALTFLIYTLYGNLVPGADVSDNYFLPSDSVLMSIFVFIGLYLLGLILGVLGVAIIFFEEKDRRYTMIAWVGLLSHVLSLVILPIAFVVSVRMIVQEIEYEHNPAKIIERAVGKKKVDLSGNQLTEVPKGLENLTQLEELDLETNQLTSVKELENLTQLETLDLDENQLTSVKGLENLTRLTELDLEDNPDLTKAQIDQLQKALPKCKIESNPTK